MNIAERLKPALSLLRDARPSQVVVYRAILERSMDADLSQADANQLVNLASDLRKSADQVVADATALRTARQLASKIAEYSDADAEKACEAARLASLEFEEQALKDVMEIGNENRRLKMVYLDLNDKLQNAHHLAETFDNLKRENYELFGMPCPPPKKRGNEGHLQTAASQAAPAPAPRSSGSPTEPAYLAARKAASLAENDEEFD